MGCQKLEEGMRPVEMHHSKSESFCSRVPVGEFAAGSLCDLFESPAMDRERKGPPRPSFYSVADKKYKK